MVDNFIKKFNFFCNGSLTDVRYIGELFGSILSRYDIKLNKTY